MKLFELLGLERQRDNPLWIAGSGGKTSLMYLLAREATESGLRVVATTTTHIAAPAPEKWLAPIVLPADAPDDPTQICQLIEREFVAGKAVVIGQEIGQEIRQEIRQEIGREIGREIRQEIGRTDTPNSVTHPHIKLCVPGGDATLRRIAMCCDWMLCEADGSKRLPVKLPNATEPVLWEGEGKMLVVLGLSAIGQPLAQCCHRFELARERLGLAPDARALPAQLALLLTEGYARYQPQILLNQAEDATRLQAGNVLAALLRKNGFERVDILSMHQRRIQYKGDMICW